MDADGQHPPALIGTLVGHWLDGGRDVVYTAKAHRENESLVIRLGVKTFYSLINWRARQPIPEDAGDFRLLSPRAAAALRQLPERNRFFQGPRQLDRLSPVPRRLQSGRAHPWALRLEPGFAGRALDRGADLVLGGASADREPARHPAGGGHAGVQRLDCRNLSSLPGSERWISSRPSSFRIA
jgi:hypothetical protein